jgi:HSP20 family protein
LESQSVIEDLKALTERIRERAYQLFERRGGTDGSALEDWLQAENDLLVIPGSDLVEADGKFELEVALPGFDAKDIEVTALPDALIVRASNIHEQEQTEGNVQSSEFGEKRLFQRFGLPTPIDVDNVTANLNRGLLTLVAPKAQQASPQPSAIAA